MEIHQKTKSGYPIQPTDPSNSTNEQGTPESSGSGSLRQATKEPNAAPMEGFRGQELNDCDDSKEPIDQRCVSPWLSRSVTCPDDPSSNNESFRTPMTPRPLFSPLPVPMRPWTNFSGLGSECTTAGLSTVSPSVTSTFHSEVEGMIHDESSEGSLRRPYSESRSKYDPSSKPYSCLTSRQHYPEADDTSFVGKYHNTSGHAFGERVPTYHTEFSQPTRMITTDSWQPSALPPPGNPWQQIPLPGSSWAANESTLGEALGQATYSSMADFPNVDNSHLGPSPVEEAPLGILQLPNFSSLALNISCSNMDEAGLNSHLRPTRAAPRMRNTQASLESPDYCEENLL